MVSLWRPDMSKFLFQGPHKGPIDIKGLNKKNKAPIEAWKCNFPPFKEIMTDRVSTDRQIWKSLAGAYRESRGGDEYWEKIFLILF